MIRASSSFDSNSGDTERVIMAASEGAMTLKLTIPTASSGTQQLGEFENTSSFHVDLREPEEHSMDIALGLLWRSLILWLVVLLLVTFGYFYNLLI